MRIKLIKKNKPEGNKLIKNKLAGFLIILIISCNGNPDYYHYPLLSKNKNVNAVIEISAGTNKKLEYNKRTRAFEIDRIGDRDRIIEFLPYVGNYGFIPSTYSNPKKGGDGDALDVLVISESVKTGSVIEILPIAMLRLVDNGELDDKIIAIPIDKEKRIINVCTYAEFSRKFPNIKKIIELWFLNYNKDDSSSIGGWANEEEALAEIFKLQNIGSNQ